MTVAKVTTSSYGNLGRRGTRKDNELVAIDGLIFATPDFAPSIANLALEATWTDAIKAGTVFPLTGLDSYEDQSAEDTIYESPAQRRKMTKRGKTRFMFQYDVPFYVHQTLMTYYNNADLTAYLIRDGRIAFYNDGGTARGFSLSMLNIGRMRDVPADGSTPAFTPVYLDLEDYRQWDMYGELIQPSWNVNDLEPLIDVTLEVSGTPTASSVIIKVFADDGYDADGSVKEIGIKGIVEADFGTLGIGTATSMTDNADGTYTFASSAAFSTGAINLVAPSAMASGGLLIKSSGAVTVTIT